MDTRPPPTGPPPPYAFMTRVYRRNLKPVALSVALISAIYAGIWGVGAFQDISDDRQVKPRIGTFDIIIGALYMGLLVIELIGIVAIYLERLVLVRIYSLLSVIGALVVMAAEMLRIVIHFMYKTDIINNCVDSFSTTCTGSRCSDDTRDSRSARNWCNDRFDRGSWTDISWFIVGSIFALFFSFLAFGYYHQLLGSARMAPSTQIRMDAFAANTASGYAPPNYPPPPLAPNQAAYDPVAPPYDPRTSKAPSYVGKESDDDYGYDKAPGYSRKDADDLEDVGPGHDHNPFRRT